MFETFSSQKIAIPNHSQLKAALGAFYSESEGFCVLNHGETSQCFIFCEPVFSVQIVDGISSINYKDSQQLLASPWEGLKLIDQIHGTENSELSEIPCVSGFLSYEFLRFIEEVSCPHDKEFPDACFYAYQTVVVLDSQDPNHCSIFKFSFEGNPQPLWEIDMHAVISYRAEATRSYTGSKHCSCSFELNEMSSDTQENYHAKINTIREQIFEGSVYQVNLSREFTLPSASENIFDLFLAIDQHAHAKHASFLVTQKHSILSASPELFFHRSDATILCSPIKGTRPRGVSEQQDQNLANELQDSSKDRAELAMIVDLVRNDLGRIAEIGSVQVRTHARLESLPNVHHLVSDIEATLSKQIVFSDIIRALFPSGSITGTPKIAAMELIATLEQRPRRIYTGSIGCVGPNRLATFSVAIRTGICADGTFRFSSGGAVVIDSIPDDEFEETLAKAQSLYLPYQAFYQSTETTT